MLSAALQKDSPFEQIVFIDMNFSNIDHEILQKTVYKNLEKREPILTIKNKPAPSCYVVVTNYPYHYCLNETTFSSIAVAYGFKINDFKKGVVFPNLSAALISKEKHQDVFDLIESMNKYNEIPSTFNGNIPEFSFGDVEDTRLKIVYPYTISDDKGGEIIGTLTHAAVNEETKKVYGLYYDKVHNKTVLASSSISEQELELYKKHPDTFFGVEQSQKHQLKDPVGAYDFCNESFQNVPIEVMLECFQADKNYKELEKLPQKELVKKYAEHHVYALMQIGWFKK